MVPNLTVNRTSAGGAGYGESLVGAGRPRLTGQRCSWSWSAVKSRGMRAQPNPALNRTLHGRGFAPGRAGRLTCACWAEKRIAFTKETLP